MRYLTKFEFNALDENLKKEYYEELRNEKNQAVTPEKMEEVGTAYEAIAGYYNSSEFARDLRKSAEKQRIADAKYRADRRKRGILITVAVIAAVILIVSIAVISSMVNGKAKRYAEAVELYNTQHFAEAKEIFESLGDYEKSKLYLIAIEGELNKETLNGVGIDEKSVVTLGSYDTDGKDGVEPLSWIVIRIDRDTNCALLLCQDIIELSEFDGTLWEDSAVREWLNGEFYNSTFDEVEKARILKKLYGEYTGEDGEDIVYECTDCIVLMSEAEYTEYLSDFDSTVKSADYTGAVTAENGLSGSGVWLLRTANSEGNIMTVVGSGAKSAVGVAPDEACGIRPMMWVVLDKAG